MRIGICIMEREPILMAYFVDPSHHALCLYARALFVARKCLGKNVTATMNTQVTIEELLDSSFKSDLCRIKGKWVISSSQNFLFLLVATCLINAIAFQLHVCPIA
jgi:hypothetical protein